MGQENICDRSFVGGISKGRRHFVHRYCQKFASNVNSGCMCSTKILRSSLVCSVYVEFPFCFAVFVRCLNKNTTCLLFNLISQSSMVWEVLLEEGQKQFFVFLLFNCLLFFKKILYTSPDKRLSFVLVWSLKRPNGEHRTTQKKTIYNGKSVQLRQWRWQQYEPQKRRYRKSISYLIQNFYYYQLHDLFNYS